MEESIPLEQLILTGLLLFLLGFGCSQRSRIVFQHSPLTEQGWPHADRNLAGPC